MGHSGDRATAGGDDRLFCVGCAVGRFSWPLAPPEAAAIADVADL